MHKNLLPICLAQKEFSRGTEKKNTLGIGGKTTYEGGLWYGPVDNQRKSENQKGSDLWRSYTRNSLPYLLHTFRLEPKILDFKINA
jgi:hypothetical protein